MTGILVAPGLFYRHLELREVLRRQRARSEAEIARHNADVTASAEPRPPVRDQVLQLFDPRTRRLAR